MDIPKKQNPQDCAFKVSPRGERGMVRYLDIYITLHYLNLQKTSYVDSKILVTRELHLRYGWCLHFRVLCSLKSNTIRLPKLAGLR